MAGFKRKVDYGAAASKKEKVNFVDRSAKRQRKSDVEDTEKPAKAPVAKSENAPQKSILKDEEKAFPRGGASALTPLEHKQIQIKATQDVLFEQSGKKTRGGDDGFSSDESGAEMGDAAPAGKKKRPKKTKKGEAKVEEEKKLKVEGLSYHRLAIGQMILGQITELSQEEITLSLPNNLTGIVPLTAISDQLTSRVEKLMDDNTSSDIEGAENEDSDDINLNEMFYVGQYLRACVTSIGEDVAGGGPTKARRKIVLSINPRLVNRGIEKSSIAVNGMLQASVISNEDHGLVMDMGLDEPEVKGFLAKSELGPRTVHSKVQEGAVFMCVVSGLNSDRRIVKLSADLQKAGNQKKMSYLDKAPTIDIFLPGTAVEMLVIDSTETTVTGKILGSLDATADIVHSGAIGKGSDLSGKYKIGSKAKARIICTFPDADPRKVGVSLLDHVLSLSPRMSGKTREPKLPLDVIPISTILEEAKVIRVEPAVGVYFDLGGKGLVGFAHVSRLAEGSTDNLSELSGHYKVDSQHRVRVVGYSTLDGSFQISLEQRVLDQIFLRLEDVPIGSVVKGKVHKLIPDKSGNNVLLVNLSDGITGLVIDMHLSDVRLQHPERKFREGALVTARVLSKDMEKRHLRLTLKKSLVNSDVEPWMDYSSIDVGATSPGTVVDINPKGAVVQFFGNVRAWLPRSEMSEAYVDDATKQFKKGQVVNVHVLSVDPYEERMLVSCKDPTSVGAERDAVYKSLNVGDVVQGNVVEKAADAAIIDLGHGVKGTLRIGQLTDGSEKKDASTMARIRVGGPLEDMVVLRKHDKSRTVTLSNKPSLRKAVQARKFITRFEDIKAGEAVHGFVRNVMSDKIFVEFGGDVVGLLFQSQLPDEMAQAPGFGVRKDQSITARIAHVDTGKGRFWLSMRSESDAPTIKSKADESVGEATVNALDKNIKTTTDMVFGTRTTARVRSIKSTQLNVHLADNVQGRVFVAEVFDNWDDIKDKKNPLGQFKMNDIIDVKVIGMHDARNHRFLPISHRQGKIPTFELTVKKADVANEADVLSLQDLTVGSSHIAFVNNIADQYVWVNISANVRGRIEITDLSEDLTLLSDIEENFPIGSALRVQVKAVDVASGRLDLTATSAASTKSWTLEDLKEGLILPARVTKVHSSHIVVHISDNIAGPVYLEQLADDYDKAKPSNHRIGEFVRVCIIEIDLPNKRLGLSMRPSRVLSSSLPIKDPEIRDISTLAINQVLRGFIKRVTDSGLFIRLGPRVDAYVRITHLSDSYLKDWKSAFQVDQLVTGKIIDKSQKLPQMSLKKTIVERPYVQPLGFSDMKAGLIVTAKVRHVETYGVFLVVDHSQNVSGLCHVSQIADSRVEDVKALYKEGDIVKAKVLKVDTEKRKIDFSLKYSQVKGHKNGDVDMEDALSGDESEEEAVDTRSIKSADESGEEDVGGDDMEVDTEPRVKSAGAGLSASGFDWTGADLDFDDQKVASDDSDDEAPKKKKKSKKATIKEDRTGDLDAFGPQSVADYERLLLGQPNNAELWVRYMVFQRELNEIEKARQIARRALATMNQREEKERLDVWTALLHLENDFGSQDVIEKTFTEACQFNDSREMHERMIKIYISSGKLDKADTLYQQMTKIKSFTPTPTLWLSYTTFLMTTLQPPSPSRARALLQRAMQSVPVTEHRYLTTKFAALEFKCANGDPERGRTIFEGLVSTWPKKGDVWDVYLSLEESHGSEEAVRALFERMVKIGGKRKRVEKVFARWREWEVKVGNGKAVERIGALEGEWREKRGAEGEVED